MEIPTWIQPVVVPGDHNENAMRIPRVLVQTFRDNIVHPIVHDNIMNILKMNRGYGYRLITDEDGRELILRHFDQRTLDAFDVLGVGAARGDFLRYVALFIYGGIYLDLDSTTYRPFEDYMNLDNEFLFFYDKAQNLIQWHFACAPGCHLLGHVIEEMVTRIQQRESNIFLATGPTLFSDVIFHQRCLPSLVSLAYRDVSKDLLKETWESVEQIQPENNDNITQRFQEYQFNMMYDAAHPRYTPTWNSPTPDLYIENDHSVK